MSRIFVLGLLLLALSVPHTASAAAFGPFLDFKEDYEPLGIIIEFDVPTKHFDWDAFKFVRDNIHVVIDLGGSAMSRVPLKGHGYHSFENPDFSGNMEVTTLYGLDLDPDGDGMQLTGFTAAQAADISFSDEVFIGNSGTLYPATVAALTTLGDLNTWLPGADLSVFQGDPSSMVYLFRATVPSADFTNVPEPSTVALAGIAVVCLLVVTRFGRPRQRLAA